MPKPDKDYEVKEHQLFISSLVHWVRLLRQNKTSRKKRWMIFKITSFVLLSAPFRWIQWLFTSPRLKSVNIKDNAPLFVIGHWRSGTTHLHYVLSKDEQFSYLGAFQAFFYRVAFVSKTFMKPILNLAMPKTRPQDNVKINANSPTEEEHCLTNITEKSGMQSFFFPKNISYFDKYNVFKGASAKEISRWKKTYDRMLRNIALFEGKNKKLLLKNPHNTGRLKVLLELYPNAKFVFIHRNPYEVYGSTKVLYEKTVKSQFLQEFSDEEIEQRIIYMYKATMSKYLEERDLIPKDQLIEVAFTELDNNPLPVMKEVYSTLNLGPYADVEGDFKAYLETVKNFKKNKLVQVPEEIKAQLNKEWRFAFEEWGYEIEE